MQEDITTEFNPLPTEGETFKNELNNFQDTKPTFFQGLLRATIGRLFGATFISKVGDVRSYGTLRVNKIPELNESEIEQKQFFIQTQDGANLDCMFIKNNSSEQNTEVPPQDKIVILKFCGKRDHYQSDIPEIIDDMKTSNAHAFLFNHRGGGLSTSETPKNFEDLVQDGITAVNYLLKHGVKPQNIVVKGHSMGGAVGAAVIDYFLDQGIKLGGYCGDRTFGRLEDVVAGSIRSLFRKTSIGDAIANFVKQYMIEPLLKAANWHVDVPPFITRFIKEEIPVVILKAKDDKVIFSGSLAKAMKQQSSDIETIDQDEKPIKPLGTIDKAVEEGETLAEEELINNVNKALPNDKKVWVKTLVRGTQNKPADVKANTHHVPLNSLVEKEAGENSQSQNGSAVFGKFVEQVVSNREASNNSANRTK